MKRFLKKIFRFKYSFVFSVLVIGSGLIIVSIIINSYFIGTVKSIEIEKCQCTNWSNFGCGEGDCTETEMLQERVCTPVGCDIESRCVSASECQEPEEPSCECTSWSEGICGAGGCGSGYKYQTRECTPDQCADEGRCVADSTCQCAGEGQDPDNFYYGCCGGLSECQYDGKCHAECCIDNDGDGYGNPGRIDCSAGSETDCNDDYKLINPGASEICWGGWDEDCDGKIDCLDSDCLNDPDCIFCDTADDCRQNPSCFRTRCVDNVCVYDQYNCTGGDGVCCFPACSYDPGSPNYDSDCKDYCPEFGTGTQVVKFPPLPDIGTGFLAAYGDKWGIKGVSSKRGYGDFHATVENRWSGLVSCDYPNFSRGFAIIDTSCIPENAIIQSANFEFYVDSRKGAQPSSVWVDNSSYPDNDNRWIINPTNFPNNGILLNKLDKLYYGNVSISVPVDYIKKAGEHTRFFYRFGDDMVSDAKLADDLYDCRSKDAPYTCGPSTKCACRWLNGRSPKCGKADPCYYASNLRNPCADGFQCTDQKGAPPSTNAYGCYHLSWMNSPITGTSPILEVTFYNPGNVPTIELNSPSHLIWVNYIPTFKAKIYDEDFPEENARAYFEISGTISSGWGEYINSNGAVSSYKPVVLPDGQWWWRAYAQDDAGNQSDWTEYWLIGKDTVSPAATINYTLGTIDHLTFQITLTESDDRSGIAEGDVDIKTSSDGGRTWGDWQNYNSGTLDFNFTGSNGYCYQFRYRVKDKAGNWSDFDYHGTICIEVNLSPSVSCNDTETWNYCSDSRNPTISWNYSDPENNPQESYWVQIDNNSDFSSPEINTGEVFSSSNSYHPSGATLDWGTTYYWRVRAKDTFDNWSDWSTPNCSFTTLDHAYPNVNFSWTPENPSVDEPVQFIDESTCYDDNINGSPCTKPNDSYDWNFENAVPSSSVLENPVATFSDPGKWQVDLTVTDSDGYSCPIFKSVDVNSPLPDYWREVIPKE